MVDGNWVQHELYLQQTDSRHDQGFLMTYILVDNRICFFRARHVAGRASSLDEKIGLAFIMFNSQESSNMSNGGHVVFCMEGRSWRKDEYEPYKKNRKVVADKRHAREKEEDEFWWEAYDDFLKFVTEQTNCTAIRSPNAEADDVIALWIEAHKDDKNVIVSTDSDHIATDKSNVSFVQWCNNRDSQPMVSMMRKTDRD